MFSDTVYYINSKYFKKYDINKLLYKKINIKIIMSSYDYIKFQIEK
jgi:hypothetical protein